MNKTLFAPESTTTTLFAVVGNPWALLGCYLLVMNLIAFFVFGLDKWKAKYKQTHEKTRRKERDERVRRVPEKTLFLLAALGGSVGALLGMRVWRHKTLHKSFRFGIPAILVLQIIIPAGLWLYWNAIR